MAAPAPHATSRRERLVAFYLPQYYPIPDKIPADLGFYDLRLPETRLAQAEFAADHGVEGFCYWHYWFGGKRLLERAFEEVLRSGEPEFGFCLGWANQPWTDTWLGTGRLEAVRRVVCE